VARVVRLPQLPAWPAAAGAAGGRQMSDAGKQENKVNTTQRAVDASGCSSELPRLRSTDLLSGAREAIIEHGQDLYRLRLTSNGKLILTK
jgi:hemin uptake protein HemP